MPLKNEICKTVTKIVSVTKKKIARKKGTEKTIKESTSPNLSIIGAIIIDRIIIGKKLE